MPEKRNPLTSVVENVAGFIIKEREAASKARPVPFMERRVPLSQARKEWAKMPLEARQAFEAQHGPKEAMRLAHNAKQPEGFFKE